MKPTNPVSRVDRSPMNPSRWCLSSWEKGGEWVWAVNLLQDSELERFLLEARAETEEAAKAACSSVVQKALRLALRRVG